MGRKELEMELQKVRGFENPEAGLEQYQTPPGVASVLLWQAYMSGDIQGRKVVDLGCGTGILAIGSKILGAEEVTGVDKDRKALEIAREDAEALGLDIKFGLAEVDELRAEADTVVQNPPFGSQERGSDRPFITKALEIAPVVYSFHMTETEDFIQEFVKEKSATVSLAQRVDFPLKKSMPWHNEEVKTIDVTLYRFERK